MFNYDNKKIADVKSNLKDYKGVPSFTFQEFPAGYFADNSKGKDLRNQLIKNTIKVSECDIGELEKVFFSKENIELINKQIIMTVYKKSNKSFLVCPQDENSLIIVMRYVFLEYAKHLPYDIKGQIKELNCRVTSEVVPTIITNADQKIGYLRDINTIAVGPPLPVNTNNLNRSLPSVSNIIHMN